MSESDFVMCDYPFLVLTFPIITPIKKQIKATDL